MYHKTLNMIYGIDDSYNNLLRSEYVSVHQKLLQFLVTEIFLKAYLKSILNSCGPFSRRKSHPTI